MKRHLALPIALLLLPCVASNAQAPAQVEIMFPQDMGRTGVFRLTDQWPELQVQVRTVDAEGRATRLPACVPTWTSASPEVLTVLRSSDQSGYVRPRAEGITELTVTYPCAPALSRRVAVVVGSAAIDKPFAASGTEASYYPARLQLTPPGNNYISGGRVYMRPIDVEVQFVASAYNGNDQLITPDEFPMKWSIANPGVLTVAKQYDHTVFLNPVGSGTTSVTFTVEGMSQSFEITVDDKIAPSNEGTASLVVRSLAISAVRTVSTAVRPATSPIALPITVRPATSPIALPITVRPATEPVALPITVRPAGAPAALPTPVVTGTATSVTRAGTAPIVGSSATTPAAPAGPVSAPLAPVQAEAGTLGINSRTITTSALAIIGTIIQPLYRSFTTPTLAITGTAIQYLSRSFTTPTLAITGTAIQYLSRSFTTPTLVIQGQ